MFAEWTIHDQLKRIQSLERPKDGNIFEGGKSKGGRSDTLGDYEGVNLDGEDEKTLKKTSWLDHATIVIMCMSCNS